eukprot:PLAT7786.1.p1 GENE.PLAT7786.1~~PLAT7786.1.p1  ORF type:complete len:254 (+),score=89.56 PLAT7786.1:49-762(+)
MNATDVFGLTPLLMASTIGEERIATLLVAAGAKTTRKFMGKTAETWAADAEYNDIATIIRAGAKSARAALFPDSAAAAEEEEEGKDDKPRASGFFSALFGGKKAEQQHRRKFIALWTAARTHSAPVRGSGDGTTDEKKKAEERTADVPLDVIDGDMPIAAFLARVSNDCADSYTPAFVDCGIQTAAQLFVTGLDERTAAALGLSADAKHTIRSAMDTVRLRSDSEDGGKERTIEWAL